MANPLHLLLLAGIAGTTIWGVAEYQRDNRHIPATPPGSAVVSSPDIKQPLIEPNPLQNFSATLERPLFYADRKIPVAEQVDNADPVPKNRRQNKLPKIRLSAILIDNEARSVVVETLGTGKSQRLIIGQSLSGWKLVDIKDQAIVMRSGARRHQFDLHNFAKPPVPKPGMKKTFSPLRPPLNRGQAKVTAPPNPLKAMGK